MYGVNGGSDAISRDINSVLYSSTFKHPADGEFAKIKQLISSDPYQNYVYQQPDESYGGNQSSLSRYRSTPTSFFSNLLNDNGDNEFLENQTEAREFYAPVMKEERVVQIPATVKPNNNNNNLDSVRSNIVRQNSTPAGFISPSRFLPQIAENKKRSRDGVLKMPQNGNLVHHMSLPKTSSEMAAVDSFLQFQQESTVPLQTRAKRGFATHPRSIAERVRRTRISERIKRLQELFPDIDKNSNTADMLDMAVEFIKNLQKELQTLNDAKARCTCSSK